MRCSCVTFATISRIRAEINVSIFRILKPNDLVAVIDSPPSKMFGFIAPLKVSPPTAAGTVFDKQILLDFQRGLVYSSVQRSSAETRSAESQRSKGYRREGILLRS